MKLAILNDTHIGLTKYKEIIRCLVELQKENPDVIVHAGDFNGGKCGYKHVRSTINIMREHFPSTPILVVLGNHDWWTERPVLNQFVYNVAKIREIFKDKNIHWIDEDGPWRKDGVVVTGSSGWYNTMPESNDWNFIPKFIQGDTHSYFLKRDKDILNQNLVFTDQDLVRIFMSHFPVQDCNPWDGNQKFGDLLRTEFGIKYFISGHSHGELNGPTHYRTATDYGIVRSKVIEV